VAIQVLCHIAERLKVLHAAGWVHRDLKPGNVLRRPTHHSWTLIDFGCTARIGAPAFPRVFSARRCTSGADLDMGSLMKGLWALLRPCGVRDPRHRVGEHVYMQASLRT
jgi:serine/threonine protein kinase